MADFEEIYIEHFHNVYKYVFSLCRNEKTAEEITQEAFYKAMEHLDSFDGRCKLYVWLCQIAKNTYLTFAKKQKRLISEAGTDLYGQSQSDFESELVDKDTAWEVHTLLHRLKEPYKEVFSLRVLRGTVIFPNRRAVRKNRQLGEAYILPRKTRNKEGLR